MKNLFLIGMLFISTNGLSQIGWYIKVNGIDWDGTSSIEPTTQLIYGLKEGTNFNPCYDLTITKITLNKQVIFEPTGLKNPWSIDLGKVLNGKTGRIVLEISGKGCTSNAKQHWIRSINVSSATNESGGFTSEPANIAVPAGSTVETSILKTGERSQHVVAKVKFTNKEATVNKLYFLTGCPENSLYQMVSNLQTNGGVLKVSPSGSTYIEYMFTNVPKGQTVYAKYEYDIVSWDISINYSNAGNKPFTKTAEYINFTRSVPGWCDLTSPVVKSIGDSLWKLSNNNYLTYAQQVTTWMEVNTKWSKVEKRTGSNTFFSKKIDGKYRGDCGTLSNAMCALLRYQGIPSRLLVGYGLKKMTEDNFYNHAWLEFYIEGYGWIPMDPSARKNGKINIGKIGHKGIVVSRDANYDLAVDGLTLSNVILQSYVWAVKGGNYPEKSYERKFTAVSSNFKE